MNKIFSSYKFTSKSKLELVVPCDGYGFQIISDRLGVPTDSVLMFQCVWVFHAIQRNSVLIDIICVPIDNIGVPIDSVGVPIDSIGVPIDSIGVPMDSMCSHNQYYFSSY